MTAGIILVLAILVLGGVIATISDRLGTKVGKARLRLFNLRPRDTAALVTMVTGSILSALTLAILFATSKPLRKGVFRIDEIQTKLNETRKEVTKAEFETTRIKNELQKARADLELALTKLNQVNQSLEKTLVQKAETEFQLQITKEQLNQVQVVKTRTQEELKQVQKAKARTEAELNLTQNQLNSIIQQKETLRQEIEQLQIERQKILKD
ncbi:MAG: DUF3084 domain-containing protein [Okeania sp. SIO3H1]|uniref:DUF3084 domain-containing protein n=1 Tax=Okeania sp. SIO1I7 TaxID=2607772 RepID=UPI0013C861FB|nr:DUF3084 domain-containing protein [Okeania sp. SIO1I7]NEN90180.1 DUF3084 domain-containing protein [Okeania sp. SIO3H1]NET25232.1 DUF3084 domain-containing protein [Okeania sp. SIO1I7]